MSQLPIIEDLCKSAMLIDPSDMVGLVAMHERVQQLGGAIHAPGLESVSECLERTGKLLEELVYREAKDADANLNLIRKGLEYAQRALTAEADGRALSDAGPEPRLEGAAAPVDTELMNAWLADCGHALNDLEANIGAVPGSPEASRIIADVKRAFHTLKGECGVISLHTAQRVLHTAETVIEREEGGAWPEAGLLAVVDWMRTYTAALAKNPLSPAPDIDAVIRQLDGQSPAPEHAATGPVAVQPVNTPPSTPATPPEGEAAAADQGEPVVIPIEADASAMLGEFLTESKEHLANAEQALLELEQRAGDPELINTVFRAFHTIKGVAGFMNLTPVVRLAHHGECLLDGARSGQFTLDRGRLDVILRACDTLGQLIASLAGATGPTKSRLDAVVVALEAACRPGSAGPVAQTPMKENARAASPATSPAANPESSETPAAASPAPAPAPASTPSAAATPGPSAAPARDGGKPTDQSAPKAAEQTVKVSTTRMDTLVDMVGELVIAHQMVVQDPSVRAMAEQQLQRNLSMVGKIIRDLQTVSMALRMVPIKATFQKMARLVRDVSAKAGKRIELVTDGEDVELDRNMVEVIADPLVHMIRNACDHGIEGPEARRAAGKPESGTIWLRAYHSGGSIIVEVKDDGKGLSRERIIAKAVERGLLSADRPAAEIPDAEVFNLIFLPGFSTAEKVTDISGRGVGMDVVRRNIEGLRGKIEISSVAGQGTTFAMRLPLTLAIIDGMVVRVRDQRYVLPTLSIERSFRPVASELHTLSGKGEMVMVRGGLLPIHRLDRVLGRASAQETRGGDLLIVVESQTTRACLAVDEIIGQQQVVIKSLGPARRSTRGVSGGAILGDGRVAPILDIDGLLNQARAS